MLKHTLGHDWWGMNSCSHGNGPRPGPHIKEIPEAWKHADPNSRCAAWLDQPWKRPCPSAVCKPWSFRVQDACERATNAGRNAARLVPYKATITSCVRTSCVQTSYLPTQKGSVMPLPGRLRTRDFTFAYVHCSSEVRSLQEIVSKGSLLQQKAVLMIDSICIYYKWDTQIKCIHAERKYTDR